MRIVWIYKSPWKKPGPIVYMGLLNALSFAQNGFETDLFVGAGDPSDTACDLDEYYGVHYHPELTLHRIPTRGERKRDLYRSALGHVELLSRQGKEVMVVTRELGCLGALISLKKRYPLLKVFHETHDYYLTCRHLEKRTWSAVRRMWAERLLLPKLDGLICLTEHQRALYQQWFPSLPMIAAPLGTLDLPHCQMPEKRRQLRSLAYIGHLHSYKGLEIIISLARNLARHEVRMNCFGGKAEQVAQLRSKAEAEGLGSHLFFEPFLCPRRLHDLLDEQISIGLVPLQDTYYSRYLTCPVKALDFLSHGLPIVASELPSVHEVLRGSGMTCECNDVEAFSKTVLTLLDDSALYANLTRRSYQRGRELLWTERARRIWSFAQST